MKEDHYLIKEAAAKVGVESHVLRYWEDELKMDIHRNEMGHRYYTKKDIEVLSKVRELKDKGLQLKAIRNYLEMRRKQLDKSNRKVNSQKQNLKEQDEMLGIVENAVKERENLGESRVSQTEEITGTDIVEVKNNVLTNEEKMEQFQQIMNRILSNAIQENNDLIGKSAGEHAANAVVNQLNGMTKEQEARAEERYKKLDQTLREIQQARLEAAATTMRPVDKRKQKRLKRNITKQNTSSETNMDKNSQEMQKNT